MTQNAQKNPIEEGSPERRIAPELPQRPTPVSAAAIEGGTNYTIYFLALENFSNRYPELAFTRQCIKQLSAALANLFETDSSLHLEIRNFLAGMPLDSIAQSAHPKRIKQLLLESILSPDILTEAVFRTDPEQQKTAELQEIARDLQYYSRLCEISTDAVSAREALTEIMKRATTLNEQALTQLNTAIESLNFKYLTDKTFCHNQKKGVLPAAFQAAPVIALRRNSHSTRKTSRNDIALKSITLFRHFEKLSEPVVSEGGETYESIQRRVQAQQKVFENFKKDCYLLGAPVREEIYKHITTSWPRFSKGDPNRTRRQSSFLDFISNQS